MRSFRASHFFIALGVILSITALLFWAVRARQIKDAYRADAGLAGDAKTPGELPPVTDLKGTEALGDPHTRGIATPGMFKDPGSLVGGIAAALEQDDMAAFAELLGAGIDSTALRQLQEFAAKQRALGRKVQVREVGEQELNARTRWAIEYGEGDERQSLYLDLKRDGEKWAVDKITLSSDATVPAGDDPLAVAEVFLQAVLGQKFEQAREHVDARKVSDARIAGLCILFEEGQYRMRETKPLRAMFQKDGVAGYLAHVVTADDSQAAQFSLTVIQQGDPAKWVVAEINLDRLLADYAQRVAGGDVYYSPLVRNPEGGDTIALYFGFDEDEINPRTRRQLEIVASILKSDRVKKLTLSGHTDAKGTDQYNQGLSVRRAEVVRDFLLASGVSAGQVEIVAMGAKQPRRPNVTETGEDDPQGRRANRRTEIYLDF